MNGAERTDDMRRAAHTAVGRIPARFEGSGHEKVTLLELVDAVCEVTDDDQEVVATVLSMLESGRVALCGNFRGHPISDLR